MEEGSCFILFSSYSLTFRYKRAKKRFVLWVISRTVVIMITVVKITDGTRETTIYRVFQMSFVPQLFNGYGQTVGVATKL